MPNTELNVDVSGRAANDDNDTVCAICPHPRSFHDRIAARFRAATTAGQFNRGVSAPHTRQGKSMTGNGNYVSLYDLRVQLVQKALRDNSTIDDQTSFDLAVHVLDALDHIPEKTR